jgi:hypothetical protein
MKRKFVILLTQISRMGRGVRKQYLRLFKVDIQAKVTGLSKLVLFRASKSTSLKGF